MEVDRATVNYLKAKARTRGKGKAKERRRAKARAEERTPARVLHDALLLTKVGPKPLQESTAQKVWHNLQSSGVTRAARKAIRGKSATSTLLQVGVTPATMVGTEPTPSTGLGLQTRATTRCRTLSSR